MKKKIILKNDVAELEKLAIFVEEVAAEMTLDPELEMNLNLVLEEIVSNVILYAYPQDEEGTVIVTAEKDGNSLVFTVNDKGKEFDTTKVEDADVTLSAEERQIGGLGIYIVKNIMNEVTYQRLDGHNVLTLKKNI